MGTQINIRMSKDFLNHAKQYARLHGFSNIQEFIKETLREKIFSVEDLTKQELNLINNLLIASEEKNLFKTEKELFDKLDKK